MDRLEGVWPQGRKPFEPTAPANIIGAYSLQPAFKVRVFFDTGVSALDVHPGDLSLTGIHPSTTATQHDFNCIDYDVPVNSMVPGDFYVFAPANPAFNGLNPGFINNPADASGGGQVTSEGPGQTSVEFFQPVSPLDFPPGSFQNQTTGDNSTAIPVRASDTRVIFNVNGSNAIPDDWQIVVTSPPDYLNQPDSGVYS